MKSTVYLETTIPSFVTARRSRDIIVAGKQETTCEWWSSRRREFELFISPFVIEEAALGDAGAAAKRLELLEDIPVLAIDDQVTRIAERLVSDGAIPVRAAADASHIAIAARHGMDFLLTWNCAHIANAQILRSVQKAVWGAGLEMPVICTPDELMGADDEN
jgi:predicted nucleic acid-binding protein